MDPLRALLEAHLIRLAVWSVLAAALLWFGRGEPDERRGRRALAVGWSVANLAIAAGGWFGRDPLRLAPMREFLALNLGLNVAYLATGVAMFSLGRGFTRGAGLAVAVHGLGLLVLDGILFGQLPTAA